MNTNKRDHALSEPTSQSETGSELPSRVQMSAPHRLLEALLDARAWARWVWRDDMSSPPKDGPMPAWLVNLADGEDVEDLVASGLLEGIDTDYLPPGFAPQSSIGSRLVRLRRDLNEAKDEVEAARAAAAEHALDVARLEEELLEARQWAWGFEHRWLFNVDLDHRPDWLARSTAPIPLDLSEDDMLPFEWNLGDGPTAA